MKVLQLSLTMMMTQHTTNADDDDDDDDDEVTQQEDSNDDNYYRSTGLCDESDKKENTSKEIPSLDLKLQRQSTKLIVFWSCILKVCCSCYQPAKISKIFHK